MIPDKAISKILLHWGWVCMNLLLLWLLLIRSFVFFSRVECIYQKKIYANLKWVVWYKTIQRIFATISPAPLDSVYFCAVQVWVPDQYFAPDASCWQLPCWALASSFFPSCHWFFLFAKDTLSSCYTWNLRCRLKLTSFYPFIIKLFLCTRSCSRLWQKAVTSKYIICFSLGKPFEHEKLVGDTWQPALQSIRASPVLKGHVSWAMQWVTSDMWSFVGGRMLHYSNKMHELPVSETRGEGSSRG